MKFLLNQHGEFSLKVLITHVTKYFGLPSCVSQNDTTLFDSVLGLSSNEDRSKVFNRTDGMCVSNSKSSTLLMKLMFKESGLQKKTTIMKLKLEMIV